MRRRWRLTPDELGGVVWAIRAVRSVRRQLRRTGYVGIVLPALPRSPVAAERGVAIVLRRLPATCLERAMIAQRWRAAKGDRRAVVVGVHGSGDRFRAHAWLDGDEPPHEETPYRELLRIEP